MSNVIIDLKNIDIIPVIKNVLTPKSRVLIMAKIIKNIKETQKPKDILKVMSLNKEEFKGALFIYGIGAA